MRETITNLVRVFTRLLGLIRGFFPAKLPHGRPEFDAFFAKLVSVYALPNNPSYQHAIATMVMNLSPTSAYKAPFYFALSIKKAMANETAYSVIQEIREQEKKAREQTGEATAKLKEVATGDGRNI